MTVGPGHSVVCNRLYRLGPKLKRLGCHIRVQQPVTIATYNEPQPDGAIVRGTDEDYAERHPGPKEVACAIEVADATLSFDRTTKQRVYANARIEQYVIINLVEHVVEVYARPMVGRGRYAEVVSLKPGEKATLMAGQGKLLTIPAKQLLL